MPRGRATADNPPNRFQSLQFEKLEIDLGDDDRPAIPTVFYNDTSRSILAKNDSPDLPFDYSLNPYRGCEHGCIYCYARPSHEYLGFSAGLDFETKIMVKMDAAELLARTLRKKSWKPQMVAFSGNTDCYQPVERTLELTRRCLGVFLNVRNPVGMITKNALVLRDMDLLREMAKMNLIHIMISITTLDPGLARVMEPRTSSPANRLHAIRELAKNHIPVGVNVAPVIPGLTDEEIPRILQAAADHGAVSAGYILLRLPGAVRQLFLDWLQRELPDRAGKVIHRVRETRAGELSDARFGSRMKGEGVIAGTIDNLFTVTMKRFNLDRRWGNLSIDHFRNDAMPEQFRLF
jgi:DNA repair photolyase